MEKQKSIATEWKRILDVDECQPNPCVHGKCTDGVNSYACQCTPGYRGDNCEGKDHCVGKPCTHGICVNGDDDYTCSCSKGWKGKNCNQEEKSSAVEKKLQLHAEHGTDFGELIAQFKELATRIGKVEEGIKCKDHDQTCLVWKLSRMCNREFVKVKCPKSCGTCEGWTARTILQTRSEMSEFKKTIDAKIEVLSGRMSTVESIPCDSTWRSRDGTTCQRYAENRFCAHGTYGSGWKESYGTFENWADSEGRTALVCPECGCKGGDVSCKIGELHFLSFSRPVSEYHDRKTETAYFHYTFKSVPKVVTAIKEIDNQGSIWSLLVATKDVTTTSATIEVTVSKGSIGDLDVIWIACPQ